MELLIKKHFHLYFNKLKVLDLSHNPIKFEFRIAYSTNKDNPRQNRLIIFLTHFNKLNLLILKGTPLEESINNYIKKEVTIYFEIEKQKKQNRKLDNNEYEIEDIFKQKCMNINNDFHLVINDLITLKYISKKRLQQAQKLYILDNLIIENERPEEKD